MLKCEGLSDADRKARPIPTSKLSLHGLVRHMGEVERSWFRRTLLREPDAPPIWYDPAVEDSELVPLDDADWESDLTTWLEECERSRWRRRGIRSTTPGSGRASRARCGGFTSTWSRSTPDTTATPISSESSWTAPSVGDTRDDHRRRTPCPDPRIKSNPRQADGAGAVSRNDEWSPDEPLGTEAFEQGDEALDEDSRLDSAALDDVEDDPSLDPTLQVDEHELEEAGAELDDPEDVVTLDGGIDDPDGRGGPSPRHRAQREDTEGWDLDAPITRGDAPDERGE